MFNFKKTKKAFSGKLCSIADGTVIPISKVEDELFSTKILGDGLAILPGLTDTGQVVSPAEGIITYVADTCHGIGLTTEDGVQILIHIGIDTVELGGKGFTCFVKANEKVDKGTPLCRVDFTYLRKKGYKTDIIMVLPDGDKSVHNLEFHYGPSKAGETCIMEYL